MTLTILSGCHKERKKPAVCFGSMSICNGNPLCLVVLPNVSWTMFLSYHFRLVSAGQFITLYFSSNVL
jgi:hypothetical protein